MIDRYLSIWEISHRWRDSNPDQTDPENLPLSVQDAIRYICSAILRGRLGLFDMAISATEGRESVPHHFRSKVIRFHPQPLPPEIENCLYRKYDKEVLSSYFIEASSFFEYCLEDQVVYSEIGNRYVDYPSCWDKFIEGTKAGDSEHDNKGGLLSVQQPTYRPSHVDKLVCQAIARTLWDEHPTMTIAAMTQHKAILEYGGGKLYTGKNTLRDWLSEVAPEDVKKPGRPKAG